MMHPDHGRDLGQLLDHLVPDLPAPADRLTEVGRRVRRRRTRRILLVAVSVTLVLLSVPTLVVAAGRHRTAEPPAGPPRPGAGTCPARPPNFPAVNGSLPASAPGKLAPTGAVRAV